ncbi:MAG: glycoside hydrolase, partial [Gemmatimonadetes bacterium]|nr:glycoside hydrolase [Gemmatimonadota bacterium]
MPAHVAPFLAVTLVLLSSCAGRPAGDATSAPTTSDARPVPLSADDRVEQTVIACLADSKGVVARYSDREVYAAADPSDPMRVLAVWQTSSGTGSVEQWSRSTDGGETWSSPRAAPINACAGGPVPGAVRASDPWVSFGPEGRAYLSGIAWTPDLNGHPDIANALVVLSSGDGGEHWEAPVAISVAPVPARAYDNLAVTADPTRPGTVYAATTRGEWPDSVTYYGRLGFARSVDGGRSWSPMRPITPAVDLERIGAPQIVVDPRSGRLFAVYTRRRRRVGSVGVSISDDGGET